jgi:hypothetical protein
MSAPGWVAAVVSLWRAGQDQWLESRVLRGGVLVAVVLLASEGLLAIDASADRLRQEAAQARMAAETARAQLQGGASWDDRIDQANRQVSAMRAMVWKPAEGRTGVAAIEDWIRGTAGRIGLNVRSVSIVRQAPLPTGREEPLKAAASADEPLEQGRLGNATLDALSRQDIDVVKIRLTLDTVRLPMLVFLAEVASQPRTLVVERLQMGVLGGMGATELELRALVQRGKVSP